MAPRRAPRRTWLVAAALSLALHAGLLVWSALVPRRAGEARRPHRLEIAIRGEPAGAPAREAGRPARPEGIAGDHPAAGSPVRPGNGAPARQPRTERDREGIAGGARGPGPRLDPGIDGKALAGPEPAGRGIELFPAEAVRVGARGGGRTTVGGARGATTPSGGTGPDALALELEAVHRAATGDYSPEVRALGDRMVQWFTPAPRLLEQGTALGFGPGAALQTYANFLHDVASRRATPDRSPTLAPDQDPALRTTHLLTDVARGGVPTLCFGACYGGSHEVTSTAAIVHIDHDDRGLPADRRIFASSGSRELDAEALSAIDATLRFTSPERLVQPHPPRWSRWEFSAHLYRWKRDELMFDPGWRPPGKTVTEDVLGKTTMTEEIRLVAIAYDAAAASAVPPSGSPASAAPPPAPAASP